MDYSLSFIFYISILSLFIFFLYIFLSRKINENILIKTLFAKNKLKEHEKEINRYLEVLNNMNDGIAVIDRDKNVIFVNPAFNKNIRSAVTPANIKRFDFLIRSFELNSLVDSIIANNDIHFIEKKIKYFDRAEEKTVNCTIFKIGTSDEYAVIVKDATYLQKIENARTTFIQNISHEIKTPITAIMGFAETLKNGAIENRATSIKFINIIEHHTKKLNYLVDDLITLTNTETGKSPVKYEKINIKSSVENSLILFEKEVKEKYIDINNNILDVSFTSDSSKFNQIVTNLIQNAVKYTEKGGIVKLEGYIMDAKTAHSFISEYEEASILWNNLSSKKGCEKFLFFSIEDTGVGVNYTNLLRLGERFFRVDSSHTAGHKGTGLGLAIVKHTLILLNGSAVIKSSLGNGFIFSFILPEIKEPS
ncbi:sensor histidine kinase [Candidatus Acidulodesulfobacterium sp. H_13]|uniref:sensor histidine kinase n=1 Tax=Candidatus Acidulodesulfobacterium sp. H_13 TaxID=3395470 RepID=UPI003AF7330A